MAKWNVLKQKEIDLILSGKYNSFDLSRILNRNPQTITKVARDNGIKIPRRILRKYEINENFFDKWNEDSAYWLGFIAADGCIAEDRRKNPATLNISLSKKEENHLKIFRDLICKDIPLRYGKVNNSVILNVCSKLLCYKLVKLGITPRKSLTLKWIENIPENFLPHFIRGYFDGDGHVCITTDKKYGYKNLQFNLLGTKDFLTEIKVRFNKFYKKDVGKVKSCEKWFNAHNLRFSTKSALYFGKWIYENSHIKLERKYNVYKDFVNHADLPSLPS